VPKIAIPWSISLKHLMAKSNMPFAQKATWYENQYRRRQSPFFRLLDRSFGFRALMAAVVSFCLLAMVNHFENCHGVHTKQDCLTSSFYEIVSIGNVESFSIVAAALVYIMEAGHRKEKEHQENLEVIIAAKESSIKGHLGRIRALENLAADGLWQDDIDLQGIYLKGLRLPASRWRNANFTGSMLKGANFRQADLQGALFVDADLAGVNFRDADLRGAQFNNSSLKEADLRGAKLEGTSFSGADLTGAKADQSTPITSMQQPQQP